MDLTPYIAKGYPGNFDEAIANVPVEGIDKEQAQSSVRVCAATEETLYSNYSPTRVRYRQGSRPELEAIVARITKPEDSAETKARAAMRWVYENVRHPHTLGPLAPDRNLSEEGLIESGRGWCNEQARVFIALCEVMEIPARVCFLFHANGRSGHTTAEAFIEGRWAFFDPTFDLVLRLPDGRLAEARDLSGRYRDLAHEAYRPKLTAHYEHIHPFVEEFPGWNKNDRPHADRGGDMLGTLGIVNYVVEGVEALDAAQA